VIDVGWTHGADHMRDRHAVEVEWPLEQFWSKCPDHWIFRTCRLSFECHHTDREQRHLWGEWVEIERHRHQALQRGNDVSNNIKQRIAEEAAASDANPDAPTLQGAEVSRPNRSRSTVYSIRLNPDEVEAVQALADAAGLPASTLVRSWIIERMRLEHGEVDEAEAELHAAQRHLAHLERHLARR
jgi:predicted transcriptional regulator